jgi:hypothetical protein
MSKLISENIFSNDSYCPAIFELLCWPQTTANDSVDIPCAVLGHPGVDPTS